MKESAGPLIPIRQTLLDRRDFIKRLGNTAAALALTPAVNIKSEFYPASERSQPLKHLLPAHLTVASAGIDYHLVSKAQLEQDSWKPPETGIATPIEFPPYLANTTYIFGHSNQRGVPQLFSSLENAQLEDIITINDGVDRQAGGYIQNLNYQVKEGGIVIADMDEAAKIIFSVRQRIPRIVLQTSLKPAGEGAKFLMDFNKLQKKADVKTNRNLDDPNSYLLLLVIGELQRAA